MPKIVSANRLADGIVVYADQSGAWVERLSQAQIFTTKEDAAEGLLRAGEDAKRNLVVEPSLVDVAEDASGLRPATLRETIRAQGPTIDFLPRARGTLGDAEPPPPESSPKQVPESHLPVTQIEGTPSYALHKRDLKSVPSLA